MMDLSKVKCDWLDEMVDNITDKMNGFNDLTAKEKEEEKVWIRKEIIKDALKMTLKNNATAN